MNTRPCVAVTAFPDTQTHWAKDYIHQLHSLGYMAGYPDGTFKPDWNMTRAEFTSALITCMGITPKDTVSNYFSDTRGNWAIGAINEAAKLGILVPSEYPTGLVPNGNIKRSEACAMLVRALGKGPSIGLITFNDQNKIKLSMYAGYIKTAADIGLMAGYSNGNFEPFNDLPRGQACTVLYKFLALEGKVPPVPTTITTSTTTGSTGNIRYVVIGDQTYDLRTVSVSFIVNFLEVPVKNITASTSNVIVNNSYSFSLNSSTNNPDILVYNNRYGINQLAISGDKLLISPSYRKIYKFKVGDYNYNSDYIKIYVKSTNQGYYLSDMGIIDEYHIKVGSQNYDIRSDKITIGVNTSGSTNNNFYDIKQIVLAQQDTTMQLIATDSVILSQLSISDIAAIFSGNTTLNLDSINRIYFIIAGKRFSLSEVTIDATGNFSGSDKVYPYSQVTMIVDDMQYEINSIQINKSKFIFYCGVGTSQEWVILNNEYRLASAVSIIKGTSIYTLDQAIVVTRNVIRINGKQYILDYDFKCRVDNKIYYIDKIDYDSSQHATIINTGGLADTTMANQPSNFVFLNKNTKYQEGTSQITIYSASKWLTFDQIFILNPSHFIYQDTNYDLIGAKVRINDLDFRIIDTSWHGVTKVMNIYLQEQ
jgi:hypothetical protein